MNLLPIYYINDPVHIPVIVYAGKCFRVSVFVGLYIMFYVNSDNKELPNL